MLGYVTAQFIRAFAPRYYRGELKKS